jgi:hypothetical protein
LGTFFKGGPGIIDLVPSLFHLLDVSRRLVTGTIMGTPIKTPEDS